MKFRLLAHIWVLFIVLSGGHARAFLSSVSCEKVVTGGSQFSLYTRIRKDIDRSAKSDKRNFEVPSFEGIFSTLTEKINSLLPNATVKDEKTYRHLLKRIRQLQKAKYPYTRSLHLMFEIEAIIEFIKHKNWPDKDDPEWVSQLHDYFIEKKYFLDGLALARKHNYYFVPTFSTLSLQDINEMMIAGLLPLGLARAKVQFDGDINAPFDYFMHDIFHALRLFEHKGSRYSPEDWIEIRRYLNQPKLNERERYAAHVLIFSLFHEVGYNIHLLRRFNFKYHSLYRGQSDIIKVFRRTARHNGRSLSDRDYRKAVQLLCAKTSVKCD